MTTQASKKIGWPSDNIRYLLKACISKTGAKQAWNEWLERRNIDDVNWAELRLLATLANRINEIDPDSPEKSRLEGIRRFVWAKNQIRLDRCIQVIDILQDADIPVMLLKGMGRIASNPALASSRFVRDIDILVPSEKIPEACDVLIINGWRPVNGILPGKSRAEPFGKIFTSETEKSLDDGDFHVDIHRSVIHYGRSGTFDDIFWERCREGQLRGRTVYVPSETDQFLHAIVHATISDPERPVDWVIDAMDAVKGIDWQLLEMELDRRRAGAAVANTLGFLEEDMELQIPAAIKKIIKRDHRNPLFNLEVQVYWRLPENRIRYGSVIRKTAEWMRSRHCLYKTEQTRQTLWEGEIVGQHINSKTSGEIVNHPITSFDVELTNSNNNHYIIDIEMKAVVQQERYLDMILDKCWFGRLVIKPPARIISGNYCIWRFNINFNNIQKLNSSHTNLSLIIIDQSGNQVEEVPEGLRIGMSGQRGTRLHAENMVID